MLRWPAKKLDQLSLNKNTARCAVAMCVGLAVLASVVPLLRLGCHLEVNYNEGWNVYNAERVAHGDWLYPQPFGWTSVNYPMLSFALLAYLQRFTHDFLFTGRVVSVLSLLAAGLLVGAVVRSMGAGKVASALAGLFCWTSLCCLAQDYVGMDDPQLLAQAFFLLALLVYVRKRRSLFGLTGAALIFVVAACIKHNPVDIPLAVFLDLALVSMALAGWFAACCLALSAVAVWGNLHFGGPFFVAQMLTPRHYLPGKVPMQLLVLLGPVLVPLALAAWTGWLYRGDASRRLALLLLIAALIVGGYFSGGSGVASNALFTSLVAVSVLLGLFLDDPTLKGTLPIGPVAVALMPAFCFVWLLIPLGLSGNWNPWLRWKDLSARQAAFERDVMFLREHPGSALCESLLECHEAGKPYLYDPFNATRLLSFHKLDATQLTDQLDDGTIRLVQTDAPLDREFGVQSERFAPEVRAAITRSFLEATRSEKDHIVDAEGADAAGLGTAMYVARKALKGKAE